LANKFGVYLLITALLLTSFIIIDVKPVSAKKLSATWGNLNNLNYANGTSRYNSTEYVREQTVSNQIYDMFPSTSGSNGWERLNNYAGGTVSGGGTTTTNVYNVLDIVANPSYNFDWSTNWWVGDFNHPSAPNSPSPYGYFGCFTNVTNSYVFDYEIYNHATSYGNSKNYFTFMWTCGNGGLYWGNNGAWQNISGVTWPAPTPTNPPPSNPNTQYGYNHLVMIGPNIGYNSVGMPYAWTGTTGMNINGYSSTSGSYTYIGWENTSPFMGDKPPAINSSTSLEYLFFVYYFYRCALGYENNGAHQTIRDSLDYAAKMGFGKVSGTNTDYNFNSSILNTGQWMNSQDFPNYWFYCKLRVLGKGNMVLPN